MAVVFESVGSIVTDGGSTIATSAPSGVVSGDYLLLFINVENNGAITTPTGWALDTSGPYWFSGGKVWCYARFAGGTSDDTPTVTKPAYDTRAVIMRLSGVDTTTPIYASGTYESASEQYSSLSIGSDGSMLVIFGGSLQNYSGTLSNDNGVTIDTEVSDAPHNFWAGHKSVDSGTTGTTTMSKTGTSLSRCGLISMVLSPAAGASFQAAWARGSNQILGGFNP